ncbi:MAG: hypothetical protein Q8O40_04860 [Chloroflexota bacterium]|nr:hypothetical protein [Chloroflexota bacterium]
MSQVSRFGIYVNPKENKAVRITSPYWFPEAPEWVLLTPEANATILAVRKLAGEKKLSATPDAIVWAPLPLKE